MSTRHLNFGEAVMGLTVRMNVARVMLTRADRALAALARRPVVGSLRASGWCPACGAATFAVPIYGPEPLHADRCVPRCDLKEDDVNVGAFVDAGLRALGGT